MFVETIALDPIENNDAGSMPQLLICQ